MGKHDWVFFRRTLSLLSWKLGVELGIIGVLAIAISCDSSPRRMVRADVRFECPQYQHLHPQYPRCAQQAYVQTFGTCHLPKWAAGPMSHGKAADELYFCMVIAARSKNNGTR